MKEFVIERNGVYWTDKLKSKEDAEALVEGYIAEDLTNNEIAKYTIRKMKKKDYKQYKR